MYQHQLIWLDLISRSLPLGYMKKGDELFSLVTTRCQVLRGCVNQTTGNSSTSGLQKICNDSSRCQLKMLASSSHWSRRLNRESQHVREKLVSEWNITSELFVQGFERIGLEQFSSSTSCSHTGMVCSLKCLYFCSLLKRRALSVRPLDKTSVRASTLSCSAASICYPKKQYK